MMHGVARYRAARWRGNTHGISRTLSRCRRRLFAACVPSAALFRAPTRMCRAGYIQQHYNHAG